MTPSEKDAARRGWMRGHVEAAVNAGMYTLPKHQTVDEFVAGIRFVHGVRTGRAAPVIGRDRCLLCSQMFKSVDAHPVCWLCRAQSREEFAS